MNVVTHFDGWNPRGYEWSAYIDPEECHGNGSSELLALEDLLWQVDNKPEQLAAVEARIAQHKEASR